MKQSTYTKLLKDLQRLQKKLVSAYEAELRSSPMRMAWLTSRWHEAEVGGRVDDYLDVCARRSAVQFILRTVYTRVLEDLGTLSPPRIRGQWGFAAFKEIAPSLGIRGYLRWVFQDLAKDFPALFTTGPHELPLPSEDLTREVWDLWHREDGKGRLVFDWQADEAGPAAFESAFLGNLYQDLDRDVRKRFALLQTPPFVEEYILDHTLTPALLEFDPASLRERGETFRIIDPTCGSGHFLIGAFHRLADWWEEQHGLDPWSAAKRALESVWGADINRHAVDIARFRLLLEVRSRTGESRLELLASVPLNLAVMDTLIPWERLRNEPELFPERDRLGHYATSSERDANSDFLNRHFHVVAGNPPYIAPRDAGKRDDYRTFWPGSAWGKYGLSAPFMERFFSLAVHDGYVGQITATSFMKRSFGRQLVQETLPNLDLTDVVDCSGASIPGFGLPTVILFGRNRPPGPGLVRAVLGKRGESASSSDASDASDGPVWDAIVSAPSEECDDNPYVSVAHVDRSVFSTHPWSLQGGQAPAVLEIIRSAAGFDLASTGAKVGNLTKLIQDEVYFRAPPAAQRDPSCGSILLIEGVAVRDYQLVRPQTVLYPYQPGTATPLELSGDSAAFRHFWRFRVHLFERQGVGFKTIRLRGQLFYEYPFYFPNTATGLGICFPAIASHGHFVITRGGSLYNRSAPVIKLPKRAKEDDYLDLAGCLNSSTLSFWMKQVFHNFGHGASADGSRTTAEAWDNFYEHDATKLKKAPLTKVHRERRVALALALDTTAAARAECLPDAIFRSHWTPDTLAPSLARAQTRYTHLTNRMVALQEELDWLTYQSYGLLHDVEVVSPDEIEWLSPGHRPFEILAARADLAAPPEEKSAWWDRHGHPKTTVVPEQYCPAHRARIRTRMERIEADKKLALLESFPFKKRWQLADLDQETTSAAEVWLLDSLEEVFAEGGALAAPKPYRLEEIVAEWSRDPRVASAAAVYEATSDFDLALVAEKLLSTQSLPDNPRRVYSMSGQRKLDHWREVWAQQDSEDRGEGVATTDKPPEYVSDDFVRSEYFAVRGKLNVPRERFIAFSDLNPTRYGWNGWRDLERGLAQVEAFTEAEGDPYNPLPPPTHTDPRRCGVTLGLWDSLEDVRRWSGADHHGELEALAQEACRQDSCPCELVKRWQAWANAEFEVTQGTSEEVVEATVEDRAALVRVLLQYGVKGATASELVRASGWSSQRVRLVLDDLVASGDAATSGRGARTMYALPQPKLF